MPFINILLTIAVILDNIYVDKRDKTKTSVWGYIVGTLLLLYVPCLALIMIICHSVKKLVEIPE